MYIGERRDVITRVRGVLQHKFIQDTLVLQAGKFGLVGLSLLSSLLVWRIMGAEAFGVFSWAQTFLSLWLTLDLTGIGPSTNVRLAMAIGANDDQEILNVMAFYAQVTLTFTVGLTVLIVLLSPALTGALYGSRRTGELAALLAFGLIADDFYLLVMTAMQARRSMKTLALMQNANQLVLTTSNIAAVLISPTPEALVIGRLVYSYSTLIMALVVYHRQRTRGAVHYPPLTAVIRRARTLPPRTYWGFGVANAVDKNITNLFLQLPMQIVGVIGGASAVGYISLAMSGITQASVLSSAVFDNMQAVVPQAVGRGDFVGLRRNFLRVLLLLIAASLLFYGVLAVVAPLVIPPLLGDEWIPAIPPLIVLCLFGVITGFGGIFSALYRALNLVWRVAAMKVLTLVISLPVGTLLLLGSVNRTPDDPAGDAAVGGALIIVLVYALSIGLTALITLPVLNRKANELPSAETGK